MNKINYFILTLFLLGFSILLRAQPVNGTTTFYTTTTTALAANTACSPTKTVTLSGWLFSVQSTSNCGFNWTSTTGGDGRAQYLVGFGTLTQATFGSDDGSQFAMNNLIWGVSTSSWTSKSMQFVGYKNGMPVSGATLNATTPSGTGILNTLVVTFTNNTAFYDVDEIRLAPNSTTCNSILFFEEITIGTATPVITCTTPSLSVSSFTNVLCNGGSNGSASVSASGGTGFTYTWSPSGGNSAGATGLSAGIYTCVTTNSCGSTSSKTVQINEPPALSTSTVVSHVNCFGNSTGAATVNSTGGNGAYTYMWSTGATTSVITSLNAGVRTVTVTDANGCTSSKVVTITQPASALNTSTLISNVNCFGNSTGAATISATGGSGPYTYLWSTAATTSVITGLTTGVRTVTVTDANGCTNSKTVTISQPASALSTTATINNVNCFGNSTGGATVNTSGGTSPYTFLWSSAATTSIITGLNAGVRTVTVTDANGCTITNAVSITQPSSAISTTATINNVNCFGNSTGAATINASGGNGPYTYLWSSAATTSVITGLNSGVRTVTVTDANGCTTTNAISISQPSSGISTNTFVNSVNCFGNSTGAATVSASGGSTPYSYVWSTAATTSVITGLNAGVRTVTVTDGNGCTSTKTVTIAQPASALSTSTLVNNVNCFGNASGSATVNTSGGTSPYTYMWSTAATTSAITGLNAGVRTVTVTDANGCTSSKSVTITQPASALNTAISITTISCFGASSGAATVTASGGTGAYTYSWSTSATASVITGQSAGIKTITVIDANSCNITNTVNISQPASGLSSTTNVTNILCNGGSTGAATVSASGGVGTLTYLWSTGATSSVITSQTSGVKTVTVTDGNNCSTTNSVTITQPSALTLTVAASSSSICFGSTSTLSASGGGGTGTISYNWVSGPASSVQAVSPSTSTTYTINITDANSCSKNATVSVAVISLPTITANGGSICSGNSFTITPSGASSYSVSGGSLVVSPATTTNYSVTGTSVNGCTSSMPAIITVSVNALPGITANSGSICSGNSFSIIPSGATTYTVSGGSLVVSPVVTTNYSVTGTSVNGCVSSAPVIVTVTVNPLPTIIANSGSICSGNNFSIVPSGATTYTVSGGNLVVSPATTTNYSITGTSGSGCTNSTPVVVTVTVNPLPIITAGSGSICSGNSFSITPSGATTYTVNGGSLIVSPAVTTNYSVMGTSGNGCASNAPVIVTVAVIPLPTITVNSGTICAGSVFTLNPSGAIAYTISGGSATVSPATTSIFSVTGTNTFGCMGASAAIATVVVNALPTLSLSSSNTIICAGETATLNANGANTYTWSGGGSAASLVVSPTVTSSYTVTGFDINNCSANSVITQSVSACLGLNNRLINENVIKVFPNPSTGIINIEFGFEGLKTTTVYNQIGEAVLCERTESNLLRIDLSQRAKGVYYINITGTSTTGNFKVAVD